MPIRYYPISKVKTNKKTRGNEFLLNGAPYTGTYYETFDGICLTGSNPIIGTNEKLQRISQQDMSSLKGNNLTKTSRDRLNNQLKISDSIGSRDIQNIPGYELQPPKFKGTPTSYFPFATDQDYKKGYLIRHFIKKTNSKGYVTEISPEEYIAVKNGHVPYDVTFWQAIEIFWKLTGPLNAKRMSQYNTRSGIIDTNKRLVEEADKTFLGIKDFIDSKYDKFAKSTE
mgnify:CR=1 FL=1